ncbi:START domain-containing protein [Paraliomyxa miuraensis]|uniref:START domain-containing protein n=1 Tax=Paraliomyxa miuraensis TaxID=376150 RepID=UPI002259AD12|nr:START domain-containing protein [Paraliomyxa miuraensis]MCX4240411.1 START domain-containing protein [Paraliomyxa miuraensis]
MKFVRLPVVMGIVSVLAGCRPSASTTPDAAASPVDASESPSSTDSPQASSETGWSPVTDEEGVVVTSRPSERSPLPIFRGVGQVDAPLVEVLAVVTDAERHREWVFSCSDSSLVEQTSESTGIVYNRTDTPWPVPDRDVVLDSRIELVDGEREVIVRFSATAHPARPPTDGVVRMTYLEGHYHLWAEDAAHTRVEYQVDSDPGGSLPTWLATRGTRDMPVETLRALRAQVARTRGLYDERIAEFRRTLLAPAS